MLTGKFVRVKFVRDRIVPRYLDAAEPFWLEMADRILQIFRASAGKTRGEIEEILEDDLGDGPEPLVAQGFGKLLEDRSEFETVAGHPPGEVREVIFLAAAKNRVAGFNRDAVLMDSAQKIGIAPQALENSLFADLKSEQQLIKFEDISAERLLALYNVSLAQAVLLRARNVEISVYGASPQRYRQLLRKVKFHRLVCEMDRKGYDVWKLRLDGPMSLFTATHKYGVQMASFLPSVLHCREFELRAELLWGPERKRKQFHLSHEDGLTTVTADQGVYVPPELAMFAESFKRKAADWDLVEESEVLSLGDGFWVPDFRLVHRPSGRIVYLEVLGFWRRASAEKHLQRLRKHLDKPFLLAVSESLRVDDASLDDMPALIHRFRQMPLADEIVRLAAECLDRTAQPAP